METAASIEQEEGRKEAAENALLFAASEYTWSNLVSVTAAAVMLGAQKKVKYRKKKSVLF